MQTIRKGVFETNSSSTHSITMCTQDEYDRWKNGELYYLECAEKFLTKEERDTMLKERVLENKVITDWDNKTVTYNGETKSYIDYSNRDDVIKSFFTLEMIASVTEDEIQEMLDDDFDRYETPCEFDEYWDNLEYETYHTTYTTKSGEIVAAFGYYGNDY